MPHLWNPPNIYIWNNYTSYIWVKNHVKTTCQLGRTSKVDFVASSYTFLGSH